MELRHARTFVTIAELGTVSKAALRLRIAQPALSRQIGALEQELGLKLFNRVGRGLVLTSEGEQLLGDCRGLLNYADALGERAQLLQHGDTGVLKIGAAPQFIEGVISSFLHRYAKRFPNVQVRLSEGIGWSAIRGMLERGEVHLGQNLARAVQAGDDRFGSHPLESVEQLAAFHPKLPLGKGAPIPLKDLAEHRLLLLDSSYVFRRTFDAACRLAGLEPDIMFESLTPHTLLTMAESGHGIAIIPSTLRTHRYRLRFTSVTYRGQPLREPLSIFWDKRRPLPRHAADFCDMLAAYVRETFPITRPSEPQTNAPVKPAKQKAR